MLCCFRLHALVSRGPLGLTSRDHDQFVALYEHPRGLETLTPVERDRAILGNIFADFSYEVATLVADGAATFLAMEQPDNLGALGSGHEGLRPASMWQWPQLADLLQKGLRTVARLALGLPTL